MGCVVQRLQAVVLGVVSAQSVSMLCIGHSIRHSL